MDNALGNENLDLQGQFNDNVGQDEGVKQQESDTNWEEQAKYFQSEKDKAQAENQKLRQYEQIGRMLESRPDIAQAMGNMLQGGGHPNATTQRIELSKDEFDPWEAYNTPSSKSYQFRQQELQDTINNAVEGQMAGVKKQVGMAELKSQLASRGLSNDEIQSFVDFASKNPAEYGVDGAINMWKSVTQGAPTGTQDPNPLDIIRQNQSSPQQGGVLNGQSPTQKSDETSMWEGILNSDRGTKLP